MSLAQPTCCSCGTTDISLFRWQPSRKGYGSRCLPCDRRRIHANKQRRRDWLNAVLDDLAAGGCCICGEPDRVVIEFHHIIMRTGAHATNNMTQSLKPWAEDIAKTRPLCANCHIRWHKGRITQVIEPMGLEMVWAAIERHRPTKVPKRIYKKGAEHPGASFTRDQAQRIREEHDAGQGYITLARKYGVAKNTIVKVVKDVY